MLLKQLLKNLDYTLVQGCLNTEVTDIYYDSRKVTPGGLFVCIVGTQRDSHDYAADVAAKGAAVLAIQHDLPAEVLAALPDVTVVKFESTRYAMALLSTAYFGRPALEMTMVGVTGTKGKTTTTHMIKAVLEAAGHKVGMVGTNGVYYPGHHYDLNNTTPESYELQKILRQLADAGCDACVMEVSSQGIMMDRVAGIHYKVGVFTNLYPDHIGPGEHSSFEEYRSWKGKLFQRCDVGVVNADDPNTEALLEGHTCKLVTYGIHAPKVDYRASEQYRLLRNKEMLGVEFTLTEPDGHTLDVQVGMPGLFSIYNALATIGVGKVLGLADAPIHEGLKRALVKGRVELVPISHKFTILIDYAHNEAATESLIETLREYNPNRLVVVFGCGFLALVFLHSLFIISGGFALHKGDSAGGAMGQAVAEAIAVVIPHQFGLTVDHGDSTFVAGIGAGTAAVAFIGIDLDNFANHRGCSFLRAVQCRALLCGALLFSFCCACIIMPSGQ